MNRYFLFRYIDYDGIEHSRKILQQDCDNPNIIISELKSFLVKMDIATYEQINKEVEL